MLLDWTVRTAYSLVLLGLSPQSPVHVWKGEEGTGL